MSHFKRSITKLLRPEMAVSATEYAYRMLSLEKDCMGINRKAYLDKEVILSLTTYNKRIFDVALTIESLFQQTIKANRIILWLAEDEFMGRDLPVKLTKLIDRGLEIRYCEDLKSYKKLIPTLALFPEALIVTVDDDIIYPDVFLENLINAHKENPSYILCYRARQFSFNWMGKLRPYMKWKIASHKQAAALSILPNGIGGILYYPGCFDKQVSRKDLFMKLAPKGDDLWFKAMTLLKGVKCKVVPIERPFFEKFVVIQSGQDIALYHNNISSRENIQQLKQVFAYLKLDLKELNA